MDKLMMIQGGLDICRERLKTHEAMSCGRQPAIQCWRSEEIHMLSLASICFFKIAYFPGPVLCCADVILLRYRIMQGILLQNRWK